MRYLGRGPVTCTKAARASRPMFRALPGYAEGPRGHGQCLGPVMEPRLLPTVA